MHTNDGNCAGCLSKINKYPYFYQPLKDWFFSVQKDTPTFHISDAGRGKIDQEMYFARGASDAHYGQSAHNYNCAIDTFFQIDGNYNLDASLYGNIATILPDTIKWYGSAYAKFKERPHFEWATWRDLALAGTIKLVE